MNIKIDSILFSDKENFQIIDRIFYFFCERRYNFFFDDATVFESDWQESIRDDFRDIMIESFEKTIQGSLKVDFSIESENDIATNTYSLKDAFIFLKTPSIIFFENAANDGHFIEGVLTKFKSRGKKALNAYKEGWLDFRNCGGKNDSINQISKYRDTFKDNSLANYKYFKALLLLDSDKKHPEDVIEANSLLSEFCNENEISFHFLEKREIENYLPLDLLDNNDDVDSDKLETLKSLNEVQKDFFDIEKGFSVNSFSKLEDIYSNLNSEQYQKLNKGFYPELKTKIEIPKLFLSRNLTRQMLLDRCNHQKKDPEDPNELITIIEKINDLL